MGTLLLTSDSSVTASGFEAQLNSGVTFSLSSRANRQTNILTDRCWLDCKLNNNYVSNPACRMDCFPSGHCLSSLLLDYAGAGGVCGGSYVSKFYPDLWPSSDRSCSFLQHQHSSGEADDDFQIKEGICSAETEALLLDQEKCVRTLYDQADSILISVQTLIWATCSWDTVRAWKPTPTTTTATTTTASSVIYDPLNAFSQGANQNHIGLLGPPIPGFGTNRNCRGPRLCLSSSGQCCARRFVNNRDFCPQHCEPLILLQSEI